MQTRMIMTMPIAVGSRCCLYQLFQIPKVKMKLADDTLYTLSAINAVIYCRYERAKKLVEFKLGRRRRMRPRGLKAGGMRDDGHREILSMLRGYSGDRPGARVPGGWQGFAVGRFHFAR